MTIEQLKARKKEMGLSNKQLAEKSGVPLGTIQKILSGETKSPRYATISALTKALEPKSAVTYSSHTRDDGMVAEPEAAYNYKPVLLSAYSEEKTIDDYLALPEGTRIELIDGRFYDMAAPSIIHQVIAGEIFTEFKNFVRQHGGPCMPFIAPADVQLDRDNKTMVQPDIFVICDRENITYSRGLGAPDLVIEIVSPSNFLVDMIIKLKKYKDAGVREYWMIIPKDKTVAVYKFGDGKDGADTDNPKMYTFEDKIPVGIWDDKCIIDMHEVYKEVEFLY